MEVLRTDAHPCFDSDLRAAAEKQTALAGDLEAAKTSAWTCEDTARLDAAGRKALSTENSALAKQLRGVLWGRLHA